MNNTSQYKPSFPASPIIFNGLVRYGISRDMPATDASGQPVKLAIIVIERANGHTETLCIREDLIAFAGEGVIEDEIKRFLAK